MHERWRYHLPMTSLRFNCTTSFCIPELLQASRAIRSDPSLNPLLKMRPHAPPSKQASKTEASGSGTLNAAMDRDLYSGFDEVLVDFLLEQQRQRPPVSGMS